MTHILVNIVKFYYLILNLRKDEIIKIFCKRFWNIFVEFS